MNGTNRALNRIILIVFGLACIGAGAATVFAAAWGAAADVWKSALTTVVDGMRIADQSTQISRESDVSWFVVGVLAVLALLVVLAIVVLANLGGGRSTVVMREDAAEGAIGPVTVRNAFASEAITSSLARDADILTSRVTSRKVKGEGVLHVSVTPRQHTPPADLARHVARLVDNLGDLLGRTTPTVISIRSGVRARIAHDRSRVE